MIGASNEFLEQVHVFSAPSYDRRIQTANLKNKPQTDEKNFRSQRVSYFRTNEYEATFSMSLL